MAAAVIAVLCALQLPDAAAAGADPHLLGKRVNSLPTVLGPDQGGLVAGARARVSVRVRPGLRSFQVWLDRRDVTREFRRLGNRRVALLRPKVGVNRLYVRVRGSRGRRDFDYARFVRVSRRGSLLQLGALRAGARGGRVPVKVLLRGKGLRLRAFLNGRRLRSTGSGGVRRFVLDGDDGLHFGRKRIRFAAFSERGAYDVERRSVRVGRDLPIPAAGGDRRVKVTQLVRLDARRSRAAKRSHTLGYRWRVVRKPKGSRATLRDAATALPGCGPIARATTSSASRSATCSSGFGADDFNTVRTQLVTEFGDVSTVEKLMGQLQKPLVADAATVEATSPTSRRRSTTPSTRPTRRPRATPRP